jgi:hypothetical protein
MANKGDKMRKIIFALLLCLITSPVYGGFSGGFSGGASAPVSSDPIFDAAGDLVQGSGANTSAKLTKGAEGTLLRAGASLNAYSTFTMADTYAKGTIPYASLANTITALAHPGAANYILATTAADTIGWINTISLGAGGFTVDADGDVIAKSVTVTQGATGSIYTWLEGSGGGTNFRKISVPDALTADLELQFPDTLPTANQFLMFPAPTLGKSVGAWTTFYPFFVPAGPTQARTYTFADADMTIVGTTDTQTLTNKTLTAPITTLARVDGHTGLSLSAAQVSGTVIRNTGQALADVNHTLPQAAEGYSFIAFVGTTLAATNYWRFTADNSPQDYMCLDGTCGKTYVSVDTPTMGDTLTCYTEQISGTGLKNEADLGIGTSAATAVKNTVAVEFDIAGTGYSKAIAETAPGNDTIPQNKYGAVGFEIGADGTIDAIEATDNATGYDSAALAIAGIPAVAAAHTRLGTVTAMSTEAGGFVFGTTELSAANTTVAYTDAAVYTPSYGWICITGKGTWSTD